MNDTGIGIPVDKLDRLFSCFSQVDASTTRLYGGSGLGLAISKQLAELMKGSIGCYSEEGKGSSFRFTVVLQKQETTAEPIVRSFDLGVPRSPVMHVQADSVKSLLVAENAQARVRILVAEDNPVNRKLATKLIGKFGAHVDAVTTGKEAIRALESTDYDLILMDVQMPEMDGIDATRLIREKEKEQGGHVPIVAMTAHAMEDDRRLCMMAGMDDYVSKPIKKQQLLEVIEKMLSRRSGKQ